MRGFEKQSNYQPAANERLKYVVYAASFDPNSGGAIFMHELVHALNELGECALLWPMAPVFRPGLMTRLKHRILPPVFLRDPSLNTPLATKADLGESTVVVYPELVRGNPLGAKNVVRWLLYKPGVNHPFEFTEGEMFFRVFEKADMPELTGGAPDLFLWKVNGSYKNEQRPGRKSACYVVRKGYRKPRIPETEDPEAINIKGMSHDQINDVFNRCEVFYSYDEATMYSQFASICGCLSIVVPGEHRDREDWTRHHELGRYGVAYGMAESEIEHARETREELINLLAKKEQDGIKTVGRFVALTRERFQC